MTSVVTSNPKVMHGTPCFAGTRVPVEIFFDYVAKGHTLDYFLEQFPTVTRAQAEALLEEAKLRAVAEAHTVKA
jgi:uncharacterized protein (DUF433 family)